MSRGTRVYLGRLPRDIRERDVEKFIRGYGQFGEISIKLGYGFVVSPPTPRIIFSVFGKHFKAYFILSYRNLMIRKMQMIVFMI